MLIGSIIYDKYNRENPYNFYFIHVFFCRKNLPLKPITPKPHQEKALHADGKWSGVHLLHSQQDPKKIHNDQ